MSTKFYMYEMHVHTKETSACAGVKAADMVDYYKSRGFTGMVITDHFLNGNTTVDRSLPWEDQVNDFRIGYDNAKKRGDEVGVDVFFGWEYSFHGNDFLTYGFTPEWLLAHPEVMEMTTPEYCDFVRAEGGMVAHAHPYREASYIDMIRLIPRNVEAVEIYNANRADFENDWAALYADRYDLLKIAGSDNHWADQDNIGCLLAPKRVESIAEMLQLIRDKKTQICRV